MPSTHPFRLRRAFGGQVIPSEEGSKAAHRRDACATYTTYLSKEESKSKFAA
jgi:hypothetical protein